MDAFSEDEIKKNCPHCDPNSFALRFPLKNTDNFWVVLDVHPLIKGHILIIPKQHLSCIGEYPENIYQEFLLLFNTFYFFVKQTYGSVSTFEHGKIGQTVFHSHIHILPFNGQPTQIVPEGERYLTPFDDFKMLKSAYIKDGKYLYFSIDNQKWLVDTTLGAPRFFRDRFAQVLGVPNRGNWKEMDKDKSLMDQVIREMRMVQNEWEQHNHEQSIFKQ